MKRASTRPPNERMTAATTFRIELLKYYDNLYPNDDLIVGTSGWKCHYAKNYGQSISMDNIRWFVKETLSRMGVNPSSLNAEHLERISAMLYDNYKVTLDEEKLAFVIKSKTEMVKSSEKTGIVRKTLRFIKNEFISKYNKMKLDNRHT